MLGIPTRKLVVVGVLVAAAALWYANSGKRFELPSTVANTTQCKVTVTADILNIRSGPADDQPIVATMLRDTVTPAQKTVQNGYRMLADGRWAHQDFLSPTSDSNCG
ncbi:SH3 domain-containing protein [Solihabitans fulvus]|uniref:SH3 domain-containing protein n=1 Tax=Solihabitans fulvus TaxID=1892852 RepID=A0A5B2XN66_9PSEU|nr:SH3 domain-containing protein [Solihabitans fulvus]KAA2264595.1 SH3 domain-containing protein [Solihabitans fulvus]